VSHAATQPTSQDGLSGQAKPIACPELAAIVMGFAKLLSPSYLSHAVPTIVD
jgi:hypothetical protein